MLLFLLSCGHPLIRDDYKSFMGIEYGEIGWMSDILFISIKNIDSMNESDIFNFVYCLVENEEQQYGMLTSSVRVYSHFFYIRAGEPKDSKVIYYFYFENKLVGIDLKSEPFLRRIKKLDSKNQYVDIDTHSFSQTYSCDRVTQ